MISINTVCLLLVHKMAWRQISGWLVLAMLSCAAAVSLRETITAPPGGPCIIRFGYEGPTKGIKFRFTKDGKPLSVAKFRVFQFPRRLSFVEVTDTDSGLYELVVEGKGILYKKAINLLGMHIMHCICVCVHTSYIL